MGKNQYKYCIMPHCYVYLFRLFLLFFAVYVVFVMYICIFVREYLLCKCLCIFKLSIKIRRDTIYDTSSFNVFSSLNKLVINLSCFY